MTQQSDERYASLLQPIRDLAANWSVDIATELEDYLEVLEGVQFSFAEGGQSLNFAEAALLIQGSACIYSKKVEYLHTLVYQALEFIAERRKRDTQGPKDGDAGEGGAAGAADDEFDDEEQFLSLDDVLEEGTGIDLDDEQAAAHMPVAVRPPAVLLALEDTGSSQGAGDGDAGNYRIASCAVHRSGALLLEARDGHALNDDLQPVSSGVSAGAGACGPAQLAGPAQQPGCAAEQPAHGQGGADIPMPGPSDDDDDFGGGMDFGGDDYGGPDPADWAQEGEAGIAVDALHQRRGGGGVAGRGEGETGAEEAEFDPYKPLDPNSRGTLKPKPFKKAAKVARKPKSRQQQRQQAPQVAALALGASLLTLQAPAAVAGGLLFPEFAYALKDAAKPGAALRQGGASRASSQRSAQTAAAFTYEEAVAGFAATEAEEEGDDGAGYYDGDAMPFGDDDDDDYYAPPGDLALPDLAVGPPAAAAAALGDWGAGSGGMDTGDPDELTYEELCRAHIEAFINAAAAVEVQSELAARVSGWRGKMAPVLEEEDARPEFDIHAYGDRILQRLADLSWAEGVSAEEAKRGALQPVAFGQVVGVGPKYEASRLFSSMLQLINNGNVRITQLGGGRGAGEEGGEGQESFTLTLLDRVLPHKRVTDYRALGGAGAAAGQAAQDAAKAAAAAVSQQQHEGGLREGQAHAGGKAAKARAGGKRHKG